MAACSIAMPHTISYVVEHRPSRTKGDEIIKVGWLAQKQTTLPTRSYWRQEHKSEKEIRTMKKQPAGKTMAWAFGAVTAFTIISILGPIIWDRQARKERR